MYSIAQLSRDYIGAETYFDLSHVQVRGARRGALLQAGCWQSQ